MGTSLRVALVSANLGRYDPPTDWPDQIVPAGMTVDVHRFTDANFPPRPKAMTSRLQCGLLKMFAAWRWVPGYDRYIWIDASCVPTPITTTWFLDRLGEADIAVFRHPDRQTIKAEVEFMLSRMRVPREQYLRSRYEGEWIADLYTEIRADKSYRDDRLYASTAFAYRPTANMEQMMTQWWISKSVSCLHDQIAWPYVLWQARCQVNVIEDNYLHCPALRYVRNESWKTL